MKYTFFLFLLSFSSQIAYSQSVDKEQAKIRKYVLKESKKGRKLDFFTQLESVGNAGIVPGTEVYKRLMYSALYKWGGGVKDAGVADVEHAYSIYSELAGKDPDEKEKLYIKKGFDVELDETK